MIEAWFDGCCEPKNPGGYAGYGSVVFRDGVRIWSHSGFIDQSPHTSNNVAEYRGFLCILEYLRGQGLQKERIHVRGDSRLVLYQMFTDPEIGRPWKMRGGFYLKTARRAQTALMEFSNISCEWIPRDENDLADELSKAELKKRKVQFKIQPEG